MAIARMALVSLIFQFDHILILYFTLTALVSFILQVILVFTSCVLGTEVGFPISRIGLAFQVSFLLRLKLSRF